MQETCRGVIGSPPDERPVRWDRLGLVLGVGLLCVFVATFIVQYAAARDLAVILAGLTILSIFVYMIVVGKPNERAGLIAALVLTVQTILFFIFYSQMSTSLTLFALHNVEWKQNLLGIPVTWSPGQYQALNPIWIMVLSPVLAWTYTHLGKTGRDLPIAAPPRIIGGHYERTRTDPRENRPHRS